MLAATLRLGVGAPHQCCTAAGALRGGERVKSVACHPPFTVGGRQCFLEEHNVKVLLEDGL